MMKISITAEGIEKRYNRRKIFSDINFTLGEKSSLAITGRNGSGKSTLLKIIAGVLLPTRGEISLGVGDKIVMPSDLFTYVGFVAPYLQLYDEFTALENLRLLRKIRGVQIPDKTMLELLRKVNLFDRRNDFVRTYSSGMKQRLKYAFALLHEPFVLLLDEPVSNLDDEGIETVRQIIGEQKTKGILIIATNEHRDAELCQQMIDLNKQVGEGRKK
jgi:heme exporter protein A